MDGEIFTANGSQIFIGPAVTKTTNTASQFAALSYLEVGLVETLGEYGDESSASTFNPLGSGRVLKGKGSRDAGILPLTVGYDATDEGQQALIAAEATNNNFAFKIVLPNRPNPTGTDEIHYFRGLVMSKRKNVGSSDNVVRNTFNIGINSEIIEVAPTAGA